MSKKEKPIKPKKEPRKMNLAEALIVFLVAILVIGIPAVTGAFPIAMGIFFAVILCAAYGMAVLHFTWDDLFDNVAKTIASVLFGLMFCLSVGFVSASWIASGTIPFMLYWGLEFINPDMFLVVAFLICGIASFLTGQAWTMIPSLGLAFIGIAGALGIPLPMAAAAIVSGCFIGDAASPLCEVPAIATISAGSDDVIGTIKSMIPTLGTAIVGSSIIYFIMGMGLKVDAAQMTAAETLQASVQNGFNLSPLTLLPLLVVFVLVFIKFPILPAVVVGALVGIVEAVLLQGQSLGSAITMMWSGYVCNTGDELLDGLLTRGGIMDFAGTIVMLLFAFSFAGIIQKMGMLETIMNSVLRVVKSKGLLVLCTSLTVIVAVAFTGSANVSSLLNGSVYKDAYKRMGLDPSNLARTMSMNAPFLCSMLPWSASGALNYAALGVINFAYWPYMFILYICFSLNVVFAFIGKFTKPLASGSPEATAEVVTA